MGDLIHETAPPLAWDHEGMPFQPPGDAVAWKVRRYTGNRGRPPVVFGEHGPLHVELDATMDDLRLALGNECGSFRLYPVNESGKELEPIACVEIKPVESGDKIAVLGQDKVESVRRAPVQVGEMAMDPMELCRMMVASRDAHDQLMATMLTTLVQSTATIQQSMAGLLTVTTNTIKVANGLDAVARLPPPPELDMDKLAEKLVDAFDVESEAETDAQAESGKEKKGWVDFLMNGPLTPMAMQMLGGFVASVQRAQNARAEAAEAAARAESATAAAREAEARAAQARAMRAGQEPSASSNADPGATKAPEPETER